MERQTDRLTDRETDRQTKKIEEKVRKRLAYTLNSDFFRNLHATCRVEGTVAGHGRANCSYASLLRIHFTHHVMHRARRLKARLHRRFLAR